MRRDNSVVGKTPDPDIQVIKASSRNIFGLLKVPFASSDQWPIKYSLAC